MLKNLKSYFLIFLITISIWIVIDFFFGRSLLNSIKYANNHGTVHPNFHHTFLPNVNKILYFAGQEYTFCTDSHGFRKSCNANKKKNKNFDIIFIGDSVTEGVGLDFEDTIVGLIENKFENRKIANMAASSYSTMIYNNKLQYLIKNDYSFNEVFVLIDPSDIQDDSEVYKISGENVISKERKMDRYNIYIDKIKYLSKNIMPMTYEILLQIKKKITNKENNLGNKGQNASKEIGLNNLVKIGNSNEKKKYNEEFKYIDLRRLAWSYDKSISYGNLQIEESINISINQMQELYNFLNSKDIPLSVVVYPLPPQLAFDKEKSLQVKIWEEFCKFKCKYFINTFPFFFDKLNKSSFREVNKKYYIQNDIHFNKLGNKAIADLIINRYGN